MRAKPESPENGGTAMLARLSIRRKLGLLVAIPIVAVVLAMVPYTAERITDAQSAANTARIANVARNIGGLIQALQQERLLALGYLSAPNLDRAALVAQSQSVVDDVARLRADLDAADVMRAATVELDRLVVVRDGVLDRSTLALTVYGAFRDANTALLDAMHLANPAGADPQGLGQLGALDALMRSNEEASSVGAILVAAAADRSVSRTMLSEAVTADKQHVRQFRELIGQDQAALVDAVDNGQAGQRIRQLIGTVGQPGGSPSKVDVSDALTAAISYAGLRRLVQDRVAREIALAAQARASAAARTATVVVALASALFLAMMGLGYTVSRSISRPLRRLTRAAAVVAELSGAELLRVADSDSPEPAPPQLAAVEVDSHDEIGELAAALNRVQATAALLLQRQVTARGNIATMFANIARRTQSLVGRQLSLIDDLERGERDPDLLQGLYRLDHVATRLRRSADSLLVVSGTIEQVMSGAPHRLSDVIRSALAEIEGFRAVEIDDLPDIAVNASLVADLRLLLAELLENATNFSPPGVPVRVSATADAEGCRILILDHGLGLSVVKMAAENRRLVERERLDVAPTTVLGLFVVGRLARRHGLTVHLQPSEGRGVTACVEVPIRLLTDARMVPASVPDVPTRMKPIPPLAIEAAKIKIPEIAEPFAWFAAPDPAGSPPDVSVDGDLAAAVGRASVATVPPSDPLPRRTPTLAPDPPTDSRSGLTRRIPGTHMVDAVREQQPDESPTVRIVRDPEAEREALNDYLSGYSRGRDDAEGAPQTGSTLAERHS
jgi:signal transduction histidine kinase